MKSIDWAAGLFEGEGCLTKHKNTWHMKIKMTDLDVLQDFFDIVRCGYLSGPYHPPSLPANHKDYYQWGVRQKQDIFNLVAEFYPLMGERRRAKFDEFLSTYGR